MSGRRARAGRAVAMLCAALLLEPAAALAGDRANVPLKNWGGFAVYRDAVYDDLERLVAAGLAGPSILNTKPLSRTEAARIVASAVKAIRADTLGRWNSRRDLEAVVDRLTAEFRAEIAAQGASLPGAAPPAAGVLSLVPVDRAQAHLGYATERVSSVNGQGRRFETGLNGGMTFESRAQIGEVLTLSLQPEFAVNPEFEASRLAAGYAKLTLWNLELLVGRDSLWWGPGLHGSMVLSNNAAPLDQIRIGAAEPFLLPWVGQSLGPTKLLAFIAQMEERRDHPRAKLVGMRGTIAPSSMLELGASYANMFDGRDRPRPGVGDYPRILFDPPSSDQSLAGVKFRNNLLFSLDGDLRLHDVQRYSLPAQDLRLYAEFGWDDTCCETNFIPIDDALSWQLGAHLLGLFGWDGVDARVEYARTSERSYNHGQFTSGHWTRGEGLAHYIGTSGRELYVRLTSRFTPDVMLGLELVRATLGSTRFEAPSVEERRLGGGMDLSVRFWGAYTLWGQYQLADVNNRNFKTRDDSVEHVLRLELTRSFR